MPTFNFADLEQEKQPIEVKPPKLLKPSAPQKVNAQYITIKIPENLDDIKIAKLRTLHADIFGKEPPHDKAHGKEWIANKIKKILS